ncbi:hypothetical protein BD311DRAFT_782483 [Dichomitus squalens]|uniref:Uncharacterized protein n=1 Tax=Dichomitus squalens TaxID=114155 RepID=A0A4Q9M5G5_9APHY|nr:hypothetical protein BD311DRAFT_782483 [Dichomitus squalens]
MALSLVISAIGTIITTLERIQTVRDLIAGNPASAITLNDVRRMIRTETARFFVTVEIARLQSDRQTFYSAWLPSITRRTTLNAVDVSPSGDLYNVFRDIRSAIQRVNSGIYALAAVFNSYSDALHIDDLVCGQAILIELFGLLLHMHSAHSTLNQARVGAASLDDPRLDADTRLAISFAHNASDIFLWFVPLTWGKRRDEISQINSAYKWIGSDSRPSHYYVHSFQDRYDALAGTPTASRLSEEPRQYRRSTLQDDNAYNWTSNTRANHERRDRNTYATVIQIALERLLRIMNERLAIQTSGGRPPFPQWRPPRRIAQRTLRASGSRTSRLAYVSLPDTFLGDVFAAETSYKPLRRTSSSPLLDCSAVLGASNAEALSHEFNMELDVAVWAPEGEEYSARAEEEDLLEGGRP